MTQLCFSAKNLYVKKYTNSKTVKMLVLNYTNLLDVVVIFRFINLYVVIYLGDMFVGREIMM